MNVVPLYLGNFSKFFPDCNMKKAGSKGYVYYFLSIIMVLMFLTFWILTAI